MSKTIQEVRKEQQDQQEDIAFNMLKSRLDELEVEVIRLRNIVVGRFKDEIGQLGLKLKLTGQQNTIFEELLARSPYLVSNSTLENLIEDPRKEKDARNVLKVQMAHLRRKIRTQSAPFRIETIWGVGYRLWDKRAEEQQVPHEEWLEDD